MKELKEFWSNIDNVINAPAEDIQKDILAYLEKIEELKEKERKLNEMMANSSGFIKIYWDEQKPGGEDDEK
jgi:hypothetical protein